MNRFPSLLLVFVLALAGCGGEADVADDAAMPASTWSTARLAGVADATALAILDGRLLVATEGARELRVVDLDAVHEGIDVPTRALAIEVRSEAYLSGADDLAARGYRLGDLWALPFDVQGLAARAPDRVFLAERSHRVVYTGRLVEAADGTWRRLTLERAFTLPGADRAGARASDWRDKGPGISGLDALHGDRRTEDFYVVERGSGEPGRARILEMDRFGLMLSTFTVALEQGAEADIEGLLRDATRYVIVRGAGRGVLQPVRDAARGQEVRAGHGVPGPECEGGWRGMARDANGTWYLVSAGDPATLAWRRP